MRFNQVVMAVIGCVMASSTAAADECYSRAGWVADLSTVSHGVDGTVTILDSQTLRVENFDYDGGGISVFFYLGATDSDIDFTNGVAVGSELFGTVFNDDTLVLTVPEAINLDNYGAISVWCVAAGISFGSGSFQAPTGPTLTLSSLPASVGTSDTLAFASCGGFPGSLLMFLVIDINGAPLFQPVLIGSHDVAGEWCLSAPVPAGVGPLDVQFQVLGFVSAGTLAFSNPGEVQFL
jgi:hypothetical protein